MKINLGVADVKLKNNLGIKELNTCIAGISLLSTASCHNRCLMLVLFREFQITADDEEEELQMAIEQSIMGSVGTEKYSFSL